MVFIICTMLYNNNSILLDRLIELVH